jgi:hypothetical protein
MYVPHVKTARTALILLAVFLCSFTVLQRTQEIAPHIYGVEGYYHIAMARMIRTTGIPHDFPWMQFSVFRSGYADLELLHHLLLTPFAGNGSPGILEVRAKTAASLFGATLLTLFFLVLQRFRCPGKTCWTAALVCGAGGLYFRLIQPMPELLSLILLLAGALLFARRRERHWPHLLLGLLFTLTGPTPQIVVGMAVLFLIGRRLAGECPPDWRMPLYTLGGAAAGFLAHPDRWDFARLVALLNWRALLAVLVAGTGVPAAVEATESKPPGLEELLWHNELVVLPLAVLLLLLLLRRRTAPVISGETVSLFLCSLAALGLTSTAARFTLFWALFTMLFSALLLRDLLAGNGAPAPPEQSRKKALVPLLILLALAGGRTHGFVSDRLLAESGKVARREMHDIGAILDAEAGTGDVVYHTRWNFFPQLLFHAPRQHYLVGENPMLMLAHGEQYLDIWQNLRQGKLADPYPFVRGLFRSRYLVASQSQERFLRRLGRDPRFIVRYQGPSLVLFTLRDDNPGFITSWQVAPLAGEQPLNREDAPGSHPVFNQPDDELPRTPFHESAPPGGVSLGYVDFRPFFPLGNMAPLAALAETVLHLDRAMDGAEIRLGASGPFQLELNGNVLLVNRDANRMALIDQWRCPVGLAQGENRLRVISARTTGDWGFFLRVVDGSGRPLVFSQP